MKSSRKTLRQEQSEETRSTLLNVSLELFVRQGYAGATVRDIAKRAGISPGLMFHYFASKQALLEEHIRVVEGGIDGMVELLTGADLPMETFVRIAGEILRSFESDNGKNLFLLANQVLSIESIPAALKKRVSATKSIEASVPLIRKGQRRGEIRKGDPRGLAVAFWGSLQGIAEVLVWNPDAPVPKADWVVSILAE